MKPVIIGSGLAGIAAALSLAPMPVILISSGKFAEISSSAWAQGGIAAAIGPDDNPSFHAEDTIKAGAGLCDASVVRTITAAAPGIIEWLVAEGARFDRDAQGNLDLGLEGGHGKRRIVHAGDASGAAIMSALTKSALAAQSIEVMDHTIVTEILTEDGAVSGVRVMRNDESTLIATDRVVLATGGAGALWNETTNPTSSRGQGLALAARAGALLGDLEFMQFHPTAIDIGLDPMPLASEALRGEGAMLIDNKGERFVDELQPRDIVAKAIWKKRADGKVFLDARKLDMQTRFHAIHAVCMKAGIDHALQPIPVAPAAHYHMGGVVTDLHGRTNVKGLWACGEVGCTGLHGANRLASNSLLEAAYMGRSVAQNIAGTEGAKLKAVKVVRAKAPHATDESKAQDIRAIMSRFVGVSRDEAGLQKAVDALTPMATSSDSALVALIIAAAALQRKESRGAQMRSDFPDKVVSATRSTLKLTDVLPTPTLPLASGA